MIYGIATAMLSNKSIVCRVWGGSEHQRVGWISRRKRSCWQKGSSRTEPPALLCARGRKYFNTDACNIKGAKAVRTAIIRVLDERTGRGARTSEGALTLARGNPRARARARRAHTRGARRFMLLISAYERRGRLRAYGKSFTRASISRASHALLSRHTALMIHLQLAPRARWGEMARDGARPRMHLCISRRSRPGRDRPPPPTPSGRALSHRNTTPRNY